MTSCLNLLHGVVIVEFGVLVRHGTSLFKGGERTYDRMSECTATVVRLALRLGRSIIVHVRIAPNDEMSKYVL